MYYSEYFCYGEKLIGEDIVTSMVNVEKTFPGFLKSWESIIEKICNGVHFDRKDDEALSIYCKLYIHYLYELRLKEYLKEFENYFYLLIAIQTKLEAAKLIFRDGVLIESVHEKSKNRDEIELLGLIRKINETVRLSWGTTNWRIESLTNPKNISELTTLNERVLKDEQNFLRVVSDLLIKKEKFTLKKVLEELKKAFDSYNNSLSDMKIAYEEFAFAERSVVNSPERCCELAKDICLEETTKHKHVTVIYENGTAVGGLFYDEDFEKIKEQSVSVILQDYEQGYPVDVFDEKDIDGETLIALTRMGLGVINYYMKNYEYNYHDADIEIAREHRKKDAEELMVKYIIYSGKVIFDSGK